jgi:hypothetical protein
MAAKVKKATNKGRGKLRLDLDALSRLMRRENLTKTALAMRLGWSRQLLYYHVRYQTVTAAELIAFTFGRNPKTFLTSSDAGGPKERRSKNG